MNKAVFIDRDGVINNDTGHYYIYKPEDFVLNAGVLETLEYFSQRGYILIMISNQGGIARGVYSHFDVEKVHTRFEELLNERGLVFAEKYYCPHHDKVENCLCRKPNGLSIEKAIARFDIDRMQSFMIGDNPKDVKAAQNAGIVGFLIEKNSDLRTIIPTIIGSGRYEL